MTRVDSGTRERLLTVAERLLLESGYDEVSVRAVCTAANVNPAAVHYHFGSKVGLVSALLQARLGPLWQVSLADRADAEHLDTAEAVRIVVDPLVVLAADPAGRLYLNLLSRLLLARQEVSWTQHWFSLTPWAELLQRNVPGLTTAEAKHRWMLAFELIFLQFGDPLAGDRRLSSRQVDTLCTVISAGLSAPAVAR
ncbi:TetR/AcrR family transcriptional regulator [Mycolicibacterium lutetiense]|uniref:AcrR family transcriptional regulator n=1 Tax=Mycolicibacterium lutetiense TaxID=1641992 RepID=A0ABS5A0I7_9MYCO|nr:TetR/AcrR family transcriptional regulator [Mycolicibacterium lutetiense]MBP2455256.1 AcrR family transcriptional regulator [Mycolicibacterium lutetiense]